MCFNWCRELLKQSFWRDFHMEVSIQSPTFLDIANGGAQNWHTLFIVTKFSPCELYEKMFHSSSWRNPITDSSWCGVLSSLILGLLHSLFRNNSEARVYLWDSKCWEYEDTSWHSWITDGDGNSVCLFSMAYTFIFQSRCNNNFSPLMNGHHQANFRDWSARFSLSFVIDCNLLVWCRFFNILEHWPRSHLLGLYWHLLSMLLRWLKLLLELLLILFFRLGS